MMGLFDQGHLRANFQIQVLSSLFFRNKGAYVVGKIINGFQRECRLPAHPACALGRLVIDALIDAASLTSC
jgi:isocitrate dehydrogenase kinase/phosphatase